MGLRQAPQWWSSCGASLAVLVAWGAGPGEGRRWRARLTSRFGSLPWAPHPGPSQADEGPASQPVERDSPLEGPLCSSSKGRGEKRTRETKRPPCRTGLVWVPGPPRGRAVWGPLLLTFSWGEELAEGAATLSPPSRRGGLCPVLCSVLPVLPECRPLFLFLTSAKTGRSCPRALALSWGWALGAGSCTRCPPLHPPPLECGCAALSPMGCWPSQGPTVRSSAPDFPWAVCLLGRALLEGLGRGRRRGVGGAGLLG